MDTDFSNKNNMLLLLISVDGLVTPGISSSSKITVDKPATCWLEPPKCRHCRIKTGVVTTIVTIFTSIYVVTMMKVREDQIFLLADRMNWKECKFNISAHSFCDANAISLWGARRRLSDRCKWPLHFAEIQLSSTTFCNLFLISS